MRLKADLHHKLDAQLLDLYKLLESGKPHPNIAAIAEKIAKQWTNPTSRLNGFKYLLSPKWRTTWVVSGYVTTGCFGNDQVGKSMHDVFAEIVQLLLSSPTAQAKQDNKSRLGRSLANYLQLRGLDVAVWDGTLGIGDEELVEQPKRTRSREGGEADKPKSVTKRRTTVQDDEAEAIPAESDGPIPIAETKSGSVLLFDRHDTPIVNGNKKLSLSNAQYDVVLALLQTGDKGLTKDELDRKSRHGDARKILKRLSASDSDWESVISFSGTTGKGYRII